jgi:hypothetical protein
VWTLIPGVPIGCRSPRKRGPYSMPIHIGCESAVGHSRLHSLSSVSPSPLIVFDTLRASSSCSPLYDGLRRPSLAMGDRQVFQSDRHRPLVAGDLLTDKAGDDDLEAARRAGRAVFRHLESFCEQLIDNFCGAARRGLTLTRGIAALTLLPLRAFWRPAIPDCVISASIVALLIHVASDSSQFQ